MNVVVDRTTGKIVTSFPGNTLAASAALGIIGLTVDEAHAESIRRQQEIQEREDPGWLGVSSTSACDTRSCQRWLEGAAEEYEEKLLQRVEEHFQRALTEEERKDIIRTYYEFGSSGAEE